MSTTNSRRRKWLRLAGLILGLIGASGAALFVWFSLAFSGGRIVEPIHWLYVLVSGLIIIGSIAVAWKWELIGGVVLKAYGRHFLAYYGLVSGVYLGCFFLFYL
jgi:hypothetical protein